MMPLVDGVSGDRPSLSPMQIVALESRPAVLQAWVDDALRAYEQAGFRWIRVWDDPVFGPSWLMLLERDAVRR